MAFVLRGTLTLAFYGTPVWGERILSIIGG